MYPYGDNMKKFIVSEDTEVVLNGKKYLLEEGDKIAIQQAKPNKIIKFNPKELIKVINALSEKRKRPDPLLVDDRPDEKVYWDMIKGQKHISLPGQEDLFLTITIPPIAMRDALYLVILDKDGNPLGNGQLQIGSIRLLVEDGEGSIPIEDLDPAKLKTSEIVFSGQLDKKPLGILPQAEA